jgi:transketolase N-terminal domain/subunit
MLNLKKRRAEISYKHKLGHLGSYLSSIEIIDEILYEASQLKIREQVLDLSKKLRDLNPRMTLLESIELSFNHLKN